jgi:hypothetical protein
MGGDLPFQFIELLRELFVGGHHLAQTHEGAHDVHAHLDGTR